MKVADDRNVATFIGGSAHDLGHGGRRLFVVHRNAYELRAGSSERNDLRRRRRSVGSIGVRHRLDDDRIGAAYRDGANPSCGGLPASTKGHDVKALAIDSNLYKILGSTPR
jgi:hypothetical protein